MLRVENICKSFSGVPVLRDVSFDVRPGEVHALAGANGAGKSTLMNIVSGVLTPDSGAILWDGVPVELKTPADGRALGISFVHQELALVPQLSVGENVFLGRHPTKRLGVDWDEIHRRTRELLAAMGHTIDPTRPVGEFGVAEQQLVEIARALAIDARLIIMDEPTASLSGAETTRLFGTISELRARGVSIIYITHRLPEIFQLADRVTVLRDGRHVLTCATPAITSEELVRKMVGDTPSAVSGGQRDGQRPGTASRRGLHQQGQIRRHLIRRKRRRGAGPGRTGGRRTDGTGGSDLRLWRARSGQPLPGWRADPYPKSVRCGPASAGPGAGRPQGKRSRGQRIGGVQSRSYAPRSVSAQAAPAASSPPGGTVRDLRVALSSLDQPATTLSGGNQQKIVLGKWLLVGARVFFFDEPTRGIDVNAKAEIHNLIARLAREGAGVVVVSSEIDEILGVADRILVMHRGRIAGELTRENATEERIVELATGGE